ncbi:unnamed protein product, partial [Cyprideis torosa]
MDLFLGLQWNPLAPRDSVHLTPCLVSWAAARRGLSLGSPPWGHPWPSCRTVFGPPDRVGRAMLLPFGSTTLRYAPWAFGLWPGAWGAPALGPWALGFSALRSSTLKVCPLGPGPLAWGLGAPALGLWAWGFLALRSALWPLGLGLFGPEVRPLARGMPLGPGPLAWGLGHLPLAFWAFGLWALGFSALRSALWPEPFADAVKLFTKERVEPIARNRLVFIVAPRVMLSLRIVMWRVLPL